MKTVYLLDSPPLQVVSIEKEPSRSVETFSGRKVELRQAVSSDGQKDYIPEEMIVRVEESQ